MSHAQLRDGQTIFLVRVAGVALHHDRVLLHRSEHDSFWALPGGRLEVGETTETALQREMLEEIGETVTTGRLLFVVENFFSHYPLDGPRDPVARNDHHEIGFYLEMTLSPQLCAVTSFAGTELSGTSHEYSLEYRWFEKTNLSEVDLRPARLIDLLSKPLPSGVTTVVNRG